jgi:hypothetical protein
MSPLSILRSTLDEFTRLITKHRDSKQRLGSITGAVHVLIVFTSSFSEALFRCKNILDFDIVVVSFLFYKHDPIVK